MTQLSDRGGPAQPLLMVRGLTKHFPLKTAMFRRGGSIQAVDNMSFDLNKGETLAIVGESGCGKSTMSRLVMALLEPSSGDIIFDGEAVGSRALSLKEYRRQVQMVFQDSYASLNPRLTIEESIAFGPTVHGLHHAAAVTRARELLGAVGLAPRLFARRFPHELSGGQRQRVNIARALALQPRLLILDEPVSALDKSVEAQVLNLLMSLKSQFGLTYLFISHDLNVVHHVADRVLVMYLGRLAEIGRGQFDLSACCASLHARFAGEPAIDGSDTPAYTAAADGRSAQSHQSAIGLSFPNAMRDRGAILRGCAAARMADGDKRR